MPIVSIIKEDGTTQKFEVSDGEILFDALDSQGYTLPHGCLSGSCSACKVDIVEGGQNLSELSFIEKNTIESVCSTHDGSEALHLRLSCRAKVHGDVSLKPWKGK